MGSSHKLAPLVRIDSVASTVNVVVNRQVDRNSRPLYAYLVLYSLLTGYIAAVAFTVCSARALMGHHLTSRPGDVDLGGGTDR